MALGADFALELVALSPWFVSIVLPLVFLGALTREQIAISGSPKIWKEKGGLTNLGLQMSVTGFMMQVGSVLRDPTATLFFSVVFLLLFAFLPLHYFRWQKEKECLVSGFVLLVLGFVWLTLSLA